PQSSKDLALTFQSQREGGTRVLIQGEIRNSSTQTAERVMVKAEGLDENGRVVSRGRVYVPGVIAPRGVAAFELRLSSSGAERRYRVEIETFEFGARRSEGQ
ncbi:MAG TPA: FxLYD domain-containing protein, partial [Methylomirabilota bacterium]